MTPLLSTLERLTIGQRLGVEIKRAHAPTLTPSMRVALTDFKLDRLAVVYPARSCNAT
jgi:hypothetical protein